MKKHRRIVSVVCVCAMLLSLFVYKPTITVRAVDEILTPGQLVSRTVEWNGQQWELESVVDSSGTPIEASYINENNHLVLESSTVRLSGYRHASYPPKDADGRQLDENNILAIMDGDDTNRNNDAFDINWRMKIENYTEFTANWYQGNVEIHYMEDGTSLVYRTSPNSATMSRVYVDFGGEWHDWSVRVRGLHATVLMDGRELFNYYLFRQPASWRYIGFRQSYEYDYDSKLEVEYLEVIDKRNQNVRMVSPAIWDGSNSIINKYEQGQPILLEADAGAADGEKKTVDFCVNGVKVGSGIDQGKITTTTPGGSNGGGGCEGGGNSTVTDNAHNATYTLENGLPVGRYNLTAVCDGDISSEIVLIVEHNVKANVVCAETINYGESVNVGINCTEGSYSTAEILLDGESVGIIDAGSTIAVSEISVGTHTIGAKLYLADGTQFKAESAKINVNATEDVVETVKINREYQLDYTVSGGGCVTINDGYFTLNLSHSGDAVTYSSDKGSESYKNLGDGKYRVVTTGGYGELYYNGQFAFSFRMPFTGKAATWVNYSGGVSDVTLRGTRVKATRLHKDIEDESTVEIYDVDMQNHYSVEFDKTDTSAQDIMVYDGEYEAVIQINSSGITVNSQDVTAAPTTKVKLTGEVSTGYYRLTVTAGLAQLFVDNKCIGSFRCPVNVHRKAIMMRNSNPEATTFVAVKDTDDVYYYSEDFEGNNEKGFSEADYWYNEEEYFVLEEGQEYKLKHQVKGEEDKYLELSGEGYYALNVSADEPVIRWKGSYEGDGSFEAIARNYRNFGHIGAKYYGNTGTWSLFVAKPFAITHTNEDGTTTNVTERRMYEIVSGVSYPLRSTEHDFELIVGYDSLTLNIDGNLIATTDRLAETHNLIETVNGVEKTYSISNYGSHGRVGFAIDGGTLKIDDFYYEGDGGAAPGVTYSRLDGNFDVYRNYKGQVVGAKNDYASLILISDDNGLSWKTTSASQLRKGKLSSNNVNLTSGKFLRIQYALKNDDSSQSSYSYALLYNEGKDTEATRTTAGGKMVEFSDSRVMIEPDGSMDGVPYSGMGTRVIQLKSGPYAGRVLYTRGGSGERRGTGLLYYSDDYKDPNFEGTPVWHEPNVQLSFASTGGIVLETQCVEMPDGTVRCYVRSDKGFLTYFESFDGGATWDPTQRKVEDLFSTSCCFSIMRVDDTETYCAFWSNDNLTSNIRYYNRPRQRASFAISYDGMKTWEFVADMEEDDRGNGGQACNHSMRTLDGAAYMGYLDQSGMPNMSRNFRQDLSKVKPLKRFTECHTKVSTASVGTVSDFEYDYSVVPKTTGDSFVNGNYIHTDVITNEYADAKVVAKTVGAIAIETDKGLKLTIGDSLFEFTNGSTSYVFNEETVEAGFVYCEDGKLHPQVAEVFGRMVYEGESEYLILNGLLSDDNLDAIIQKGSSVRIDKSRESNFLADVNSASLSGNGRGIEMALADYQDVLGFSADVSGVKNVDAMYKNMTGITYSTIKDVETAFTNAKKNRIKIETTEGTVALSTVSGGFDNWGRFGKNSGTVSINEGVASIDVKKELNKNFAYGTPGLEIPEDEYNFTFGYKYAEGGTNVKIGNGENLIDMMINPNEIVIYTGAKTFKANVNLVDDKWYTFCGTLKDVENGKVLSLYIKEDSEVDMTVCVDEPISRTSILKGFWLEWNGDVEAKVQLKDVRVYKGKALDVISYTAENGTASAMVDFLNDGENINGIWVDEDFSSDDVDFNDRNPFYQSTKLTPEHFSVTVHDGYMDYSKYISGTNVFEQDILLPTLDANVEGDDINFEYDLMIPDAAFWQKGTNDFMYFDIYFNHPLKAFRQTMFITKDRIKVGNSWYTYESIVGDESGDYEGKWMSFKHHYYFDGTDWNCDFYYKGQSETMWNIVKNSAMNPSTSKSSYIRFYSYSDTQTRICLDNIKVYSPDEPLSTGQIVMGIYNNDRQAGMGLADAKTSQLGAFESKRYTVESFDYADADIAPEVKFFVWNLGEKMKPTIEHVLYR